MQDQPPPVILLNQREPPQSHLPLKGSAPFILIAKAFTWHQGGLDFADALHLAGSNAQDSFATFDQALIKKSAQLGATPKVFTP